MGRYLQQQVINDLEHKMAFVGGPRQVGENDARAGDSWECKSKASRIFKLGC